MTSAGKRNLRDLPQLFGRTSGADWHLDHYGNARQIESRGHRADELAARARARRRSA